MLLDPDPEPDWRTGTAIDEFTPIYKALAIPTKHRRGFSPGEVDDMDITVCAVLLGVGAGLSQEAADRAELADLVRRRQAGEDVTWGE